MATDARGHTVPAAADHPQRSDLLSLSLTTNGLTTVADTTARTAYVAALAAASPVQTVSTSKPAFVYRTDSGTVELSTDGTTWTVLADRTDSTYVPVWGSSGTAPAVGNGTIVGNYSQDDKFVDFDMTLTLGTTSTVGTGTYTFTLPVAPVIGRKMFAGSLLDLSAGSIYPLYGHANGSTTLNLYQVASPVVSAGATAPVVPANGDVYHVHGRYRYA